MIAPVDDRDARRSSLPRFEQTQIPWRAALTVGLDAPQFEVVRLLTQFDDRDVVFVVDHRFRLQGFITAGDVAQHVMATLLHPMPGSQHDSKLKRFASDSTDEHNEATPDQTSPQDDSTLGSHLSLDSEPNSDCRPNPTKARFSSETHRPVAGSSARDWMRPVNAVIRREMTVSEIVQAIEMSVAEELPVIDPDHVLRGAVTIRDLLAVMMEQLPRLLDKKDDE